MQLEFYLYGKGKFPKITSPLQLGTLFGKHPKTISREIRRGQVEHCYNEGLDRKMVYSADYAEGRARDKDSGKGPQLKLGYDYAFVSAVGKLISDEKYSPYAVLARFENEGWPSDTRISEKTLYNYIYGGLIPGVDAKSLLMQGKGRKPASGRKIHSNPSLAARSIETRPDEVDGRQVFGHWEGDTVVGGKGKGSECLLTITERKTRTQIVRKLEDKSAHSVMKALDTIEREVGTGDFRRLFKSITFDNGPEFTDADGLEKSFQTRRGRTVVFYAHPYSASERGTNERHNGMIRRFVPKGSAIGDYRKSEIRKVQDWMNNYPRKILKGKTPALMLRQEFQNQTMILRFFGITSKEAI